MSYIVTFMLLNAVEDGNSTTLLAAWELKPHLLKPNSETHS